MSKRRVSAAVAALGFAAVGVISAGQQSATADAAPQIHDVVGVGSDVIQNSVDFLADGSPFGDPGYNSAGNLYRVFNFDAGSDANGRLAYTDPNLGTSVLQNPSVVLRAGQSPEKRPNGGGAGIKALLADTNHAIDYVRSPNLPTSTDETTASSNLHSSIHVIQFADDSQYIATTPSTHAPAGLSTEALAAIYCQNFTPKTAAFSAFGPTHHITAWNQVPGNTSGSANAIVALRPQDGAGVLKPFQSALGAFTSDKCGTWNDGSADSVKVTPVQQNDPSTITGNATKDDAIVPFPLSRFKLLAHGYFPDPNNAAYSGSNAFPIDGTDGKTTVPLDASGITLQIPSGKPGAGLSGTTAAAAGSYYADLPFYILFRDSDLDADPWQPGGTLNWVQELFYNDAYTPGSATGAPAPFFASAAAKSLVEGLGLTFNYADKGSSF